MSHSPRSWASRIRRSVSDSQVGDATFSPPASRWIGLISGSSSCLPLPGRALRGRPPRGLPAVRYAIRISTSASTATAANRIVRYVIENLYRRIAPAVVPSTETVRLSLAACQRKRPPMTTAATR